LLNTVGSESDIKQQPAQANRLKLRPATLPVYENHKAEFVSAFEQMNSEQTSLMEKHQATASFLSNADTLLETIMALLKVQYRQRTGFECAFVSGIMFALQQNSWQQQKIYQHWLKDSHTLILFDGSLDANRELQMPIVIDFDQRSSVTADGKAIRLKDVNLHAIMATYSFVGSNFEYDRSQGTCTIEIGRPKRLTQEIFKLVQQSLTSNDDLTKASKYIIEELEMIMSPEFAYPVDAVEHLNCYVTAALSFESNNGQVEVEVLYPKHESQIQSHAVLITDLASNLKVILNIKSPEVGGSIDQSRWGYLGRAIGDLQHQLAVNFDEAIVFNIVQCRRHKNTDYRYQNNPKTDYFYYKSIVGIANLQRDIVPMYKQTPLLQFNIVDEIYKVLGPGEQDLAGILQKLHQTLQISSRTDLFDLNVPALFQGLLHYERKSVRMLRVLTDLSILFTLSVAGGELLSIWLRMGTNLDNIGINHHNQPAEARRHKMLKIGVRKDIQPTDGRRSIRYMAAFDNFGPETPQPVGFQVTCSGEGN